MPNGKPNPECEDCNGTGEITLLTSSCICDCVNREEPEDKCINDDGNWDIFASSGKKFEDAFSLPKLFRNYIDAPQKN